MDPASGRDGAAAETSSDARQRAELEALHETAVGLIEQLELETVLRAIVERAGGLVGTEHGYLYLREPREEILRVHVGTGVFEHLVGYRLAVGDGLGGRVAASGEPVVVENYQAWDGGRPELQTLPFRAVVGVPLANAREVTGVLGLAHIADGPTFGPSEVALLTRFARLAALALENARHYAAAQAELARRRRAEEDLLDTIARLRRSERDLRQAHAETIRRLGYVAEFRNAETGKHIERMSRICVELGRRLGLDDEQCELLLAASALHDIGKIAISDDILLKAGALTRTEREVVERHAELGHRLLAGSRSELLELAATIALTHHEWFDGTGYPRGLSGEEIPLAGRIASVADVFDALTSDRPYRPAMSVEDALAFMERGRGTHFDPLVLDALHDVLPTLLTAAGSPEQQDEHEPHEQRPSAVVPRERDEPLALTGAVEPLDPMVLRRACAAALESLREAGGRRTIEECLSALVAGLEDNVLASVYVREHDRLWLIAQRGYTEVLDGFSLDHGVMARAVRTGRTQFVPDVRRDPDFLEATSGILAEVTVPFGDEGGPQGALNIETIGATLPPQARSIFDPLARRLAECLAEMREGLEVDVATLARLCVHTSSLRGTSAIAEFVARTVGRLLGLDCVQLDLRPEAGVSALASFWRREASGLEPLAPLEVERLAAAEDQTRVKAAYHLFDLRESGMAETDPAAPWIVWFPLRVAGGTVGAIISRSSTRPAFEHDRVEAATLFAQHAAALLDVSLALRREQRAASTDALTGLLNRRGFDERLHEELERAARTSSTFALVLADCDNLKTINDRGGHELGDRVLQTFASCLRSSKHPGDAVARVGGDEFAVLVPGGTAESGARIAERLTRELQELRVAEDIPVVATFGVATFPADGETAANLLRSADRALYTAKRGGRGRGAAHAA